MTQVPAGSLRITDEKGLRLEPTEDALAIDEQLAPGEAKVVNLR